MRNYNYDYINTKYALIRVFLNNADESILDISYSMSMNSLTIQFVLLEGKGINIEKKEKIKNEFKALDIFFKELHLTKEQFNENRKEWEPKYYTWLDNLLFSKAEQL